MMMVLCGTINHLIDGPTVKLVDVIQENFPCHTSHHHSIIIPTNTMRKFSPFDKKDHLMCVTLDGFDTTLAAVGNYTTHSNGFLVIM